MPTIKLEANRNESRGLDQTRRVLLDNRDALGREQSGLIAQTRELAREIKMLAALEESFSLREAAYLRKQERLLAVAGESKSGSAFLGLAQRMAGRAASARAAKLSHKARKTALRLQLSQAMRQLKSVQSRLNQLVAQMSANRQARLCVSRLDPKRFHNGAASGRLQVAGLTEASARSSETVPAVRLQNLVGTLSGIA